MGKIRIILSRIIPFVWFTKLKELHRNIYRKRQRSIKASEKVSYIRRLQLLIRKLKAGKKDLCVPKISINQKSLDSFSRKTIQKNTAFSGNSRDGNDEEKLELPKCEIGTIKEVHLPERHKWNVVTTIKNEIGSKRIVLRKRGDGRIKSLRSSSNPVSKAACCTPGHFGSDNKNYKLEGAASDLCNYRLSVSSVELSAETNDYDWDKDLASFASASSFTRSLEDESSVLKHDSSVLTQTKERSTELISDAQTSDSVSQTGKSTDLVCLTSWQNNASVDHDDRTASINRSKAQTKRSRGVRRRALPATGSEKILKTESHQNFCNPMLDNSWCSSILESTSKGWIDGFSCNLKPFERISHQRLRSSCTAKDSRLRRSDWKPEEKLAAVFRPRLASVCGCAQRDRRWKETEFTEALVKRKATRRNREIKAPNGGKRFMDEMHYANNESPTVSKVRNSVPVVKCSFDPYEELRVSMVEMIVKKELHETQDLDELLRCYLSLNPPSYHDLIVRTFKDVWQEILGHP